MKCLKSSALAVLSAAALFSVAGSANAATGNIIDAYRAALLCKGTGGGSLIFDAKGNIQNRGTNPVFIDCPLPNLYANVETVTGVVVFGRDNSSKTGDAGAIRCKVVLGNSVGTTETSAAYSGSTGSGVSVALDLAMPTPAVGSTQSVRCTIPVRNTGDAITTLSTIAVYSTGP